MWLFFNSSRPLLIDSCIFSILFSRFLIIFTVILNSFSGSLPISSSFIWTSVFLICSFVCVVFLCLFFSFFFLTYCICGRLFPGFKVEFFLLVTFLLRLCKLHVGWYLCCVCLSVCLFFLWWARLSEVVILSADDWVCIFVFFVVWMRVLHRLLLVVGWCWVLYSSGFLCVSSHYLTLPRVSSLVV